MIAQVVTLDVREDTQSHELPCHHVIQVAAGLGAGQALRLIAPFEPVPLFAAMQDIGFSYEARPLDSGDWEVLFTPRPAPVPTAGHTHGQSVTHSPKSLSEAAGVREVDVRGLEPPQPLITILEALADLPLGIELRARTVRPPLLLYPHLEQRGFTGDTQEQSDGTFVTRIRHA
jgi:uncharacterized protein (DUF2249 family)